MIDFGGGFGVPYFEKTSEFDLDRFGEGLREIVSGYKSDPRLEGCRFLFELGRYLVADAGVYVTRVVDVKETAGKTFAVTDGGMNHHLTATGNMGQVFRKAYPLLNLTRMDGAVPEEGVAVAGPCCTPLDSFGNNIPLAGPRGRRPHRRLLQRRLRLLGLQPGLPQPPLPRRGAPPRRRGRPAPRRRQPEDVLNGQKALTL
jgi:diaminopimelate decarboxylase